MVLLNLGLGISKLCTAPADHLQERLYSYLELLGVGLGVIGLYLQKRELASLLQMPFNRIRLYVVGVVSLPGKVDDPVNLELVRQSIQKLQPPDSSISRTTLSEPSPTGRPVKSIRGVRSSPTATKPISSSVTIEKSM
ncbi:hypothetical protein [Citrifermentans bremense]